ncbi:type III-B CRISPR module-associated Cmr3 family protein [Aphanothece minutissima]|uniref:type III-B CRISPR module-associated Cmr3 family protein n=1 Tax=Aphanothece minutissima TaxID=543815 RepID=UPI0015E761FF
MILFNHLITLEPLGLLHGSSGRFLSAENLTGRTAEHFPPDSPAFSGLISAHIPREAGQHLELFTAGPFWVSLDQPTDPYLPAPLNLIRDKKSGEAIRLEWCEHPEPGWHPPAGAAVPRKPVSGGWIPLSRWTDQDPRSILAAPWCAVPHLHPRLQSGQRVSAMEDALFLEYGMAIDTGFALAYLSSHTIPSGTYRFGGEGHLVNLEVHGVPEVLESLLKRNLHGTFSLVTPGVWGSNRLSQREPLLGQYYPWRQHGKAAPAVLTDRPRPWRYRLGSGRPEVGGSRLSRGRWALPAGSCYHLRDGASLPAWPHWNPEWFPNDRLSLKHFGTGLALPLSEADSS